MSKEFEHSVPCVQQAAWGCCEGPGGPEGVIPGEGSDLLLEGEWELDRLGRGGLRRAPQSGV